MNQLLENLEGTSKRSAFKKKKKKPFRKFKLI